MRILPVLLLCLLQCLLHVNSLLTCNPDTNGNPSPYLNPLDKSCTITPDKEDAELNTLNGKLEVRVVVTNNILGKTSIKCLDLNCANSLKLYAAGKGSFELDCSVKDGCRGAMIQVGEPDTVPNGFIRDEFNVTKRGINDNVDIDCLGKGSCIGSMISIVGDYPGGVKVTAMGQDSFDGGQLICNVGEGQDCKLVCDESTSCDTSELVCISGNCQCIGNSCPILIFPLGSDPEEPKVIGESPNVPGLQCIAGTDDNPPDECRFERIKRQNKNGGVVCSENYDCCLCETIKCQDCTAVTCNGDQSCIGVGIDIEGDEKLGAVLNCNGDLSCKYSTVNAEGLIAIKADGDLSLMGSELILNQNAKDGDKLPPLNIPCNGDGSCMLSTILAKNVLKFICDGDSSCHKTTAYLECKTLGTDKGCLISCGGDHSCSESSWESSGVVGFSANGDYSANKNSYNITMVEAGGPFVCGGDNSCEESIFNLNNVGSLECVGDEACGKALFDVLCTLPHGCPVVCGGDNSCEESKFNLNNVGSLECVGDEACEKTLFDVSCVLPHGCPVVCGGDCSCLTANWDIINARLFSCAGPKSCKLANMNVECLNNGIGCPIVCGGVEGCLLLNLDINNVFSLACNAVDSCKNANIDMNCVSPGEDKGCLIECSADQSCYGLNLNSNNVGGLTCVGTNSCKMSTLNLECSPGTKGCPIRCGGIKSCIQSNFTIQNVGEVTCQGKSVCVNATMNIEGSISGTPVTCQGVGPCIDATLTVNNAYSLTCAGSKSCRNSIITLNCADNIDKGCQTICGSVNSCYDVKFNINNAGGISCVREGCTRSNFIFSNNKGGILSCVGARACELSTFNRLDNIFDFSCTGNSACKNAKIYGSCEINGCALTCSGYESCKYATLNIGNVKELKCDNSGACEKADIIVTTNQEGFKGSCATKSCQNTKIAIKTSEDTKQIIGFECGAAMSCYNSEIIFDGTTLIGDQLYVNSINCGGAYSCKKTKFIFKNAKISESALKNACTGLMSCDTDYINFICQDSNGVILEDVACID